MTDRADAARGILAVSLFSELMAELEAEAVNHVVHAKYDDHAARQNGACKVNAIRDFRARLEQIAKEDQATKRKQVA